MTKLIFLLMDNKEKLEDNLKKIKEKVKKLEHIIEGFLTTIRGNDLYKKSQSIKQIKKFNSLKNYQKIAAIVFITYIAGCMNGKNSIKNYSISDTNIRSSSGIQKAQQKLQSNKQIKPERESSALRAMREANENVNKDTLYDSGAVAKRREQIWKENEERKKLAKKKKGKYDECKGNAYNVKLCKERIDIDEYKKANAERNSLIASLPLKTFTNNVGFKYRDFTCDIAAEQFTRCIKKENDKIVELLYVQPRGETRYNKNQRNSTAYHIKPNCGKVPEVAIFFEEFKPNYGVWKFWDTTQVAYWKNATYGLDNVIKNDIPSICGNLTTFTGIMINKAEDMKKAGLYDPWEGCIGYTYADRKDKQTCKRYFRTPTSAKETDGSMRGALKRFPVREKISKEHLGKDWPWQSIWDYQDISSKEYRREFN